MTELSFSIRRWAAWAPGLATRDAWEAWARAPRPPRGDETPPLTDVPANTRRRLDRMGRMVLEAGLRVQGDARGAPLVFATRYGEAARTDGLLEQLAAENALSPAGFALSVHNALAGQYAIARSDVAPITAVANGRFTLEAGVVEAVMLLDDGADEVVLLSSDVCLPPRYAPWADDGEADFAFAWALGRGHEWSLTPRGPGPATPSTLPHSLDVFRAVLAGDVTHERRDASGGWRWARHG